FSLLSKHSACLSSTTDHIPKPGDTPLILQLSCPHGDPRDTAKGCNDVALPNHGARTPQRLRGLKLRKQLTAAMIEKLSPPVAGRLEIFDAVVPALTLRITPNGARSFVVRGRIKGQREPIRITLGDARGMKLTDARQAASEILRAMRAGNDPREIKRV